MSECQNPNNFTFGKDENNKKEHKLKITLSGDIDKEIFNYENSTNKLFSSTNENK